MSLTALRTLANRECNDGVNNPITGDKGNIPLARLCHSSYQQTGSPGSVSTIKQYQWGESIRTILLGILTVMGLLLGSSILAWADNNRDALGDGMNLRGSMDLHAYAKAGETVTFSFRRADFAAGAVNSTVRVYIYSPTGLVYTLNPANNTTYNLPAYTVTAATEGIWTARMIFYYSGSNPRGSFNYYGIDVRNASGAIIPGRVYSNRVVTFQQPGVRPTFTLYTISEFGYKYNVTYRDFYGIDASLQATRTGIVPVGSCISAYRSIDTGTGYQLGVDECGIYKQFLSPIDVSMPETASIFDYTANQTKSTWLNPSLVENPTVTGMTFTPGREVNPAAGKFTALIGNYSGRANLEIDVNNNGVYTDAVDRVIPFDAIEGNNTIPWDGLSGTNVPVGCSTPLRARILLNRAGEIHITLGDVEILTRGITVMRTNGVGAPDYTLHWNDNPLSNTGRSFVPSPKATPAGGVNSSAGVHGWSGGSREWGDARYIDNWAFAPTIAGEQEIAFSIECDFGDAPASYSTVSADNGPVHRLSADLYIGAIAADGDVDGIPTGTQADGDDLDGTDDEDGISTTPPILLACTETYSITVPVHNSTGALAYLGGWVDFNRNGKFDPAEFATVNIAANTTTATLTWNNIQNLGISAGQSYIRLRLSSQEFASAGGYLPDGEVEDYPVTIQPNLVATASVTNASACATADGSVSFTVTGGTGNFQYSLNGGAFTSITSPYTLANLARGGYTIIIRDANATSCSDTLKLAIDGTNCCDFNQLQEITFQAFNPGPGFTVRYLLTSPAGEILAISNTGSFPAQAQGSYYIQTLVYNSASPAPTGVTVGQNASGIRGCCFQLSPPTPIGICECPTFTLLDNNYQVCAGQNLALLRVTTSAATPNQVEFVYFTTQQTSASAIYGGGTVLGTATPTSNVAQLSNVSFPATAGTYYVYSRISPTPDDSTCRPYAEIPVIVTTPDPVSDIVLSVCNNETVDLATYFPGGGSFSAVNGSLTGSVFSGISSGVGSYTVVYTPTSLNCSAPANTIIIVRDCTPPACDYPISSAVVDASCGSSDGRATVSLGGLPTDATVGYAWSNGKTGPSISGLAAGVYSVTATISSPLGTCTVVDQIQVNEIGGPVAEISLVSAADCLGATGAVAINVKSGTGPFQIVWSGTASGTQNGVNLGTTTIPNLAAGQYTFEITSTTTETNCSSFLHVTIPQDDSDQITLTATPTNATACGSPTGSIQITATPAVGVTGPFSFSLNGVEIGTSALPTYTINGLVAGAYTVGVSSAGGCSAANIPVVIEETGAPAIAGWAAVDPTCPSDQGQLTFTGGQSNATFKIRETTTGALLATVSGATATMLVLPAGTYSIEQTTAGSTCKSVSILTINRPEGLDFNVQYTKVTCAPGGVANTDGSISIVQITGGTPPYTSTVLDSQQQMVSNLQAVAAGVYSIQVVDSKGCRGVENIFVTVPDCEIECPIVPMNTFVVDANCTAADGRAVAQLGSYTENEVDYQWSNDFFGKNTNGLASGAYSVTATILTGPFIGCAYVETINVNQIGGPVVTPGIINPSSCASSTGSVSFSITVGNGPFAVTWSGAMSGSRNVNGSVPFQFTQSGLAPGDYIFTFKGADSDCISTLDVNIPVTSTNDITLVATPNPTSGCGAQDGSITLTASGSGPNYIFSLNGVAYTSVSVNTTVIPTLPAGVYTVGVASAANGCETKQTVIIKETGAPEVTGWTAADALCASETGTLTYSGGTGSGTYRVLLGAKVIATTPANEAGPVVHDLPQGVYTVEFKDGACTSFQNFTITGPKGIDFNVQYVAETCGPGGIGNGDGTLNVIQITGGTAPYTVSVIDNKGQSYEGASHANLLAGNYYVSVVDANGCKGNNDALVTVPPCEFKCPPLAFNTAVIDNQCGETNGQATAALLNVPAGATVTYLWSNGQNGPVATGLTSGVYSVTATLFADNTIYAGCMYVDTVNVNDIGGPVVTVSATAAASCTTANGSVALDIQRGTGPYTIDWIGAATGSQTATSPGLINIANLPAGNYVFTVTDASSSCKSVIDVVIPTRTPNGFTLAVNPTLASSCAASDGRITINVSGGTGPFTYSVNGFVKGVSATRSFSVNGLPAGVYTVEVMDANGCVVNKENVLINSAGEPAIAGWNATNALCPNENGTIVFGGNGAGTDEYVVTIAGTATEIGRTAGNVAATYMVPGGTYLITRTTATGCSSVTTVTVTQPDGLDFNVQYQNPSCASPTSGSLAVVQPNGGTAPHSYTVTGVNGVVSDLTALTSGSYTVTLGDSRGCTFSQVVTLTDGANLTLTAAATPAIVCVGQPIALSANATGGTSPLTYAWTGSDGYTGTGQTATATATISGVQTYTVIVTDAVGCTAVQSTTVTVGEAPIATATPATVCVGETVTIEATIGGANYAWSGPNFSTVTTTSSIIIPNAQLANAGEYSVTITGGSGCTGIATAVVTVNAPPVVVALVSSGTVCLGDNLILTASADPGANTTYEWSGPNGFTATGALITLNNIALTASGSYTVVATSATGCSSSAVVTDPVTVTICCVDFGINVIASNAHCGQPDGGAVLTASGGTAPYSYAWSNGMTSSSVSTLAPGSYTATVTDAIGCSTTALVTIGNVEGPQLALVSTTPAICLGATGVASVTVSGGTAPYSYVWSTGASGATASGLVAGVYSVTVSDATGCVDVIAVEVESTPGDLTSAIASTPSACGQAIGGAAVTVNGGTAPYTYQWSTGATTASLSGLVSGVYSVVVTDANQCSVSATVSIDDLSGPSVALSGTAVSCFGSSTGQAVALGSGGVAPYSYVWSTGATTASVSGLVAGVYSVVITDANGCSASENLTITQPPVIVAELSALTIACGSSTGDIVLVSVTGGVSPYSYLWSTGATTASLTAAPAGTHSVVITDANGCVANGSATLVLPTDCCVDFGINVIASNAHCGQPDGGAVLTASGGTAPYSYAWSNGMTSSSVSTLAPGSYTATVTDAIGCSTTALVTIGNVEGPQLALVSTTPAICLGATGVASVTVSGGTAPYTYQWSNGATGASASGLVAGVYSVTVSDATGCVDVIAVEVERTPGDLTSAIASTPSACGQAIGVASVTASGGTAPYSYLWNTGGTTASLSGLVSGVYSVVVTDANQCSVSATVSIDDLSGPSVALSGTAVSCFGSDTGEASALASGGTAPYSYVWSNGATTASVSGLVAGVYSVVITDANGCSASENLTITQPPVIVAELSALTIACGSSTGDIVLVSVSGGVSPYSYLWSTGATTASLTAAPAGTHSVVITDANGCVANGSATLVLPTDCIPPCDPRDISLVVLNPHCSQNDGVVTASLSGTIAAGTTQEIVWRNAVTNAVIATNVMSVSGLTAGNYSVSLTLTNGDQVCSYSAVSSLTDVGSASLVVGNLTASDCGLNNGHAELTVSGSASFTITYSGPVSGTRVLASSGPVSLSGLAAGTYSVQIRDANGCVATNSFEIELAGSSILNPIAIASAASCLSPDGSVTVNWTAVSGASSYSVTVGAQSAVINGTSATFTDMPGGSYVVTVSIVGNASCGTSTTNVTIPVTDGPVLAVNAVQPLCAGEMGVITVVNLQVGVEYGLFSQAGSLVSTGTSFTMGAGTYVVRATSSSCQSSTIVTIEAPKGISFNVSVSEGVCGNPGSLTVLNISGGSGSYTTQVSGPAGIVTNLNSLVAGSYTVTVTDANGCSASQVVNVKTGTSLLVTVNALQSVVCEDGVITLTASVSPAGSYTYVWSGPNFTTTTGLETVSIANATLANNGIYTVLITSATGCTALATTPAAVTVTPRPTESVVLSICNNETVDLATRFPTGGTFTELDGSNALTGSIFNGIVSQAGTYKVLYTSAVTGCGSSTAIATIVVRSCSPPPCNFPISTAVVDANCGANDGRAQALVGGLPAGSSVGYNWSNGASGPQITGLVAGVYSVTATVTNVPGASHLNGCILVDTVNVNDIGAPVAIAGSTIPASCPSNNNGQVTLDIQSGTAPFVISYTGPSSGSLAVANLGTQTVTGLPAGNYVFRITSTVNNASCSGFVPVHIPRDDAARISLTAMPTSATACGSPTGRIQYTVNLQPGVTAPFTYLLNGQVIGTSSLPTFTLNNVVAGSYVISVISADGCTSAEVPVLIEDAGVPAIAGWTATNATCPGDVGALTFAGGQESTTQYRVVSVVNGGVIATVPGNQQRTLVLSAGPHAVIRTSTTDNCTSVDTLIINAPTGLDFNVQYTAATCAPNGAAQRDGSIRVVQIEGGKEPYTVRILDNNNGIVSNANALAAGNYVIEVTDANGCAGIQQLLITIPDCQIVCPVLPLNTVVVDANCGASDGKAVASLAGLPSGSSVNYVWSNGQNGPVMVGLTTGIYSVTATITGTPDGRSIGCSYAGMVNVNEIGGPIPAILAVVPSRCSVNTGSVSLSITAGTAPYTVSWTGAGSGSQVAPNASSVLISNLAPGDYTFVVKGSGSDCQGVINVTVPVSTSADITIASVVTAAGSCGASNGSLAITINGGTPNYIYTLNGIVYATQASTSLQIPNLPAGYYNIGVTSANGCITNTVATIGTANAPEVAGWTAQNALCADNTGTLIFAGGQPATVSYRVLLGGTTLITTVAGNQSANVAVSRGVYVIERRDNGCVSSYESFTITSPEGIDFNVQYTGETCAPGGGSNNDGKIQVVQISGGTAPYTVVVLNAQNEVVSNLNALAAGQYTIRVSDVNSCTGVSSVLITVPPCPKVCPDLTFNTVVLDTECGQANGTATATLLGIPVGSFVTYQWSNGQNGSSISGLASGTYSVTATITTQNGNYNGCQYVDVLHVNELGGPIVNVSMTMGASCTASNGSAILEVLAGAAPYTVSWTGAASGSRIVNSPGQILINGLAAGDYIFTVSGGTTTCQSLIEVTIPQNDTAVMQVSATPADVSGCGAANGSITVNVAGGVAPFFYTMNGYMTLSTNSRTASFPNLPAGAYQVTVSDANGCSVAKTNVLINTQNAPVLAGWSKTDGLCAGANGTLSYVPTGNSSDQYIVRIAGSNTIVGQITGNVPLTLDLPRGTYLVTRTGSNACVVVDTLVINQPEGLAINVQVGQPTCTSLTSGSLTVVQISGGTLPYTTNVNSASGVVANLTSLAVGSYTVTVSDANGCQVSQVVSLTTGQCDFCFDPYVYLQGALVDNDGVWPTNPVSSTATGGVPLMRDELRALGIIPLTDPYRAVPYITTFYPGGIGSVPGLNPFNETITNPTITLADRGENSVVDWVLVEFRDKSNPSLVRHTRSGLVLRNGKIVDVDGTSCLNISHVQPGDYYVAVRHRNHLGVMTQTTRSLNVTGSFVTVDFRTLTPLEVWHDTSDPNIVNLYGDKERRDISWKPGYYALWGGNANRENKTIYQGQMNDPQEVFNQITTEPLLSPGNILNIPSYVLNGYYSGDVNMNGRTIFQGQYNDTHIIYNIMIQHPSNVLNTPSFIIVEQLP